MDVDLSAPLTQWMDRLSDTTGVMIKQRTQSAPTHFPPPPFFCVMISSARRVRRLSPCTRCIHYIFLFARLSDATGVMLEQRTQIALCAFLLFLFFAW